MDTPESNGTVLFAGINDRLTNIQIQEALFIACSSFGPVLRVSSNRKTLRGKAFVTFLHLSDAIACASRLHDAPFLSTSLSARVV